MDTQCLASYAIASYAASSCIWLDLPEDARHHATEALVLYAAAPEASRSPSREAIARIDLGLALTALGSPDEGCALGHEALSSDRVVDSVRSRASELDALLQRRYPNLAEAAAFHERSHLLMRKQLASKVTE